MPQVSERFWSEETPSCPLPSIPAENIWLGDTHISHTLRFVARLEAAML